MQTVVYNAQLIYRAEVLYFEHVYPSSVVQTVRQYVFDCSVVRLFIR